MLYVKVSFEGHEINKGMLQRVGNNKCIAVLAGYVGKKLQNEKNPKRYPKKLY
jgi:hypothetical protein